MSQEYIVAKRASGREFVIYRAPKTNRLFRRVGYLLLALSFLSFLVFLGPIFYSEISYRLSSGQNDARVEQSKISLFGYLLWLDKKNISSPVDWHFGLLIPKIGVNARVLAEINPHEKETYNLALKESVAHAAGTSLPGQIGTTYLFAPSSNFLWGLPGLKPFFYQLKNLKENDEVIIFYQTKKIVYKVKETKITEANNLPPFVSQKEKQALVLQTCWPPGTDWKRLFVLAEPVQEN